VALTNPASNKRIWGVTIGGLATLGVAFSALQEANPLTGSWDVYSATVDGKPVANPQGWRVFLDIDGDYAEVASYWTCGVKCESFAEGVMVRDGSRIDLYKRVRMTPELEKTPSGYLTRLPNGRLACDISFRDGGSAHVEFFRASNATTIFDLLNWR
jgi:hypothetical protein